MRFKEWLVAEEIHRRVNQDVTVTMPGETPGTRVEITFDNVDFRWERYLDQNQIYGKWYIDPRTSNQTSQAEMLRKSQGVQGKFPFNNLYIAYHKRWPTMLLVGPYQEGLDVMPPEWYKWAQFMQGEETVYWVMGPNALGKRAHNPMLNI